MRNSSVDTLKSLAGKLPAKNQDIANSLVGYFLKHNKLSDKQWHWVNVLIERATETPEEKIAAAPVTQVVGDMSGVVALFAKAKEKLQYPAIMLCTAAGTDVRIHIAGQNSKAPGYIQVTSGTASLNNDWYGRVSPEGEWTPSRLTNENPILKADLFKLLTDLSSKPAETAAAYGHLTGRCCFCKLSLTDERSTAVGYGKTCASNYGLPWGAKKSKFEAVAA